MFVETGRVIAGHKMRFMVDGKAEVKDLDKIASEKSKRPTLSDLNQKISAIDDLSKRRPLRFMTNTSSAPWQQNFINSFKSYKDFLKLYFLHQKLILYFG